PASARSAALGGVGLQPLALGPGVGTPATRSIETKTTTARPCAADRPGCTRRRLAGRGRSKPTLHYRVTPSRLLLEIIGTRGLVAPEGGVRCFLVHRAPTIRTQNTFLSPMGSTEARACRFGLRRGGPTG